MSGHASLLVLAHVHARVRVRLLYGCSNMHEPGSLLMSTLSLTLEDFLHLVPALIASIFYHIQAGVALYRALPEGLCRPQQVARLPGPGGLQEPGSQPDRFQQNEPTGLQLDRL